VPDVGLTVTESEEADVRERPANEIADPEPEIPKEWS